jgi:predicted nuclease of predicted toxin-antitoxin system
MARLTADHNSAQAVIRGLRSQIPGLDIVTARSVGLRQAADPALLAWAAANHRIVLTHDRQTMIGFAYARIAAGEPMAGLIVASDQGPTRVIVGDTELLLALTAPDEWPDRVGYVPV